MKIINLLFNTVNGIGAAQLLIREEQFILLSVGKYSQKFYLMLDVGFLVGCMIAVFWHGNRVLIMLHVNISNNVEVQHNTV